MREQFCITIIMIFLLIVGIVMFFMSLDYAPKQVVAAVVEEPMAPAPPTIAEWSNKARADCFRLGGHTRFYGNVVFCTRKDYPLGRTNTLLFERRRHLPSGED